jgi:predicted component of type VI protein secretion system
MPYLIITDKQHELDRHELTGQAIVGRSPDCDVVVRDVLLSRHHCRFESKDGAWVVVDLGSKNGTFIEGRKVECQPLSDADIVRCGRTRIIFRAGKYIPPPPDVLERKAARRPADPIEALSGTMVGFEFTDMEENSRVTGFPIPRPRPVGREHKRVPAGEDLLKPPPVIPPEWDLALREAPAAPPTRPRAAPRQTVRVVRDPGHTEPAPEPARIVRSTEPQQFATAPRWLALIYAVLVYLLCALVMWLISWR